MVVTTVLPGTVVGVPRARASRWARTTTSRSAGAPCKPPPPPDPSELPRRRHPVRPNWVPPERQPPQRSQLRAGAGLAAAASEIPADRTGIARVHRPRVRAVKDGCRRAGGGMCPYVNAPTTARDHPGCPARGQNQRSGVFLPVTPRCPPTLPSPRTGPWAWSASRASRVASAIDSAAPTIRKILSAGGTPPSTHRDDTWRTFLRT